MKAVVFSFILIIMSLFFLNGFAEKPKPDNPEAVRYQKLVDDFKNLHSRAEVPKDPSDLTELKKQVNANDYFKVFKNISMEDGWELDYIYWADRLGSFPILYARKIGEKVDFKEKFKKNNKLFFDYLNHIKIDGTKDGFFQYTVLSLLGNQFALYWHALYNDTQIISTRNVLFEYFVNKDNNPLRFENKSVRDAKQIDPAPEITFENDRAVVRIITFTKWGGFSEQKFHITRSFPHKIIKKEQNVLAPFDCGIVF